MGWDADEGAGAGVRGWQPDMDTGAYPVIDACAGDERLAGGQWFAGGQSGPDWPYDPRALRASDERQAQPAAGGRRGSPRRWIAVVFRRTGR